MQIQTIEEFVKAINVLAQRALNDDHFKEKYIADPKAYITKEAHIELPKKMEVEVIENTKDTIHLVLPIDPRKYSKELSTEDLENVSGGILGITAATVACVSLAAVGAAPIALGTALVVSTATTFVMKQEKKGVSIGLNDGEEYGVVTKSDSTIQ